jgi:plasmid stability protein
MTIWQAPGAMRYALNQQLKRCFMATLNIPDQTLARLRTAAAARHVSVEAYLDEMAAAERCENSSSYPSAALAYVNTSNIADRTAAAYSIRKMASKIGVKSTVEELIADRHVGHGY